MYVFPYYDASSNNGNHIRVLSPSEKGGKVCFRMGRNKRILSIPAGMGLEQTRNWLASQFYGSGWTAVDNGDDSYSISYYIEKNHTVGFDPMDSGLELEITESVITDNEEEIYPVLSEIRASGFRINMDDFGTGMSSLNMLLFAPVDVL